MHFCSVFAGAGALLLFTACASAPADSIAVSAFEEPTQTRVPVTAITVATVTVAPTATPTRLATATEAPTSTPVVATPTITPVATAAETPAAAPVGLEPSGLGPFPLPVRLRIPKIGVDTGVEAVGLDDQGAMETPRGFANVAWYGMGPAPGQAGASVVAGHVDSTKGPAVFWSLQKVVPGDTIQVDEVGGRSLQFVVDRTAWFAPDAAPLSVIFDPSGPPRLNLITCGGVFDRGRHEYDRRLVVFAHLVDPAGGASDSPNSP